MIQTVCRFADFFDTKQAVVLVQDCLKELISSMSKNITVVGNKEKDICEFDYQLPLLSLPYAFKLTYKTVPKYFQYLKAKENLIKYWDKKIDSNNFKIGIAWKGSDTAADRFRSFSPKEFEILSNLDNVTLISLQKNRSNDLKSLKSIKILDFTDEIDEGSDAFLDTAAIIKNLDLVITCDTSIAHLSGALGCPTWIMLGKQHDWRWFLNNDHSIWYPSVKLFRQTMLEDWKHPFQEMKKLLIQQFNL